MPMSVSRAETVATARRNWVPLECPVGGCTSRWNTPSLRDAARHHTLTSIITASEPPMWRLMSTVITKWSKHSRAPGGWHSLYQPHRGSTSWEMTQTEQVTLTWTSHCLNTLTGFSTNQTNQRMTTSMTLKIRTLTPVESQKNKGCSSIVFILFLGLL